MAGMPWLRLPFPTAGTIPYDEYACSIPSFVQGLSSSTKDWDSRGGSRRQRAPQCSQRIPEDEAFCTTNVKGIEWTRFPDVPVIVSLYVPVRAGLFTLMVN